MKTKNELNDFYESELKSDLSSLEKFRKNTKKKRLRATIISLIILGLFILLRWMKNNMAFFEDK